MEEQDEERGAQVCSHVTVAFQFQFQFSSLGTVQINSMKISLQIWQLACKLVFMCRAYAMMLLGEKIKTLTIQTMSTPTLVWMKTEVPNSLSTISKQHSLGQEG